MMQVNDLRGNDDAHLPFGGEQTSGLGHLNGDWTSEECSTVQQKYTENRETVSIPIAFMN